MTDNELIEGLEQLQSRLIAVATGGPRIKDVNEDYQQLYATVAGDLVRRRIDNPIPFGNLWDWYGRWSSGDMPTWQGRRTYISELIQPLINRIRTGRADQPAPTGWTRVDRVVDQIQDDLARAKTEEQFQGVGLLCREVLISLAQAVYERDRHPPLDNVEPGVNDAKRMLEAYIAVEMPGGANEEARKHARSSLDLTNALQHRRTATFKDAALCVEATTSVINVIAIVAGRRDPED